MNNSSSSSSPPTLFDRMKAPIKKIRAINNKRKDRKGKKKYGSHTATSSTLPSRPISIIYPDDINSEHTILPEKMREELPVVSVMDPTPLQTVQTFFHMLRISFENDEEGPLECYEDTILPYAEWMVFKKYLESQSSGRLQWEYDPRSQIFHFKMAPSTLHASLSGELLELVLLYLLLRQRQLEMQLPAYKESFSELGRLTDTAVEYKVEEEADVREGIKIPDLQLRSVVYNPGSALGIGEIACSESLRHVRTKVNQLLEDKEGDIHWAIIVKVYHTTPRKEAFSKFTKRIDHGFGIQVDVFRSDQEVWDEKKKCRVSKNSYDLHNIRTGEGVVRDGAVKFWLSDFFPNIDWGVDDVPVNSFFEIPYSDFIRIVDKSSNFFWSEEENKAKGISKPRGKAPRNASQKRRWEEEDEQREKEREKGKKVKRT